MPAEQSLTSGYLSRSVPNDGDARIVPNLCPIGRSRRSPNVTGVQLEQGDLAGALASYRKALGIAETLAARDPANTDWQRDLSVSYEKIGNVQLEQGDLAGALASYRKTLGIAETLAARDPANAEWQRDLIVSLVTLGKTSREKTYLVRALKIAVSLQEAGKLVPADEWMVDDLKKAVAQ
jgi:tetratricopeptide (TPR) repeat protein